MTTAIDKREDAQYVKMEQYINDDALAADLAKVATPHMQPERLTRLFLAAASADDRFVKCTPASVTAALMECSQVGLEPNTPFDHCWLLPYWDSYDDCYKLRFQPGYKGMLKLAFRSGEIDHIQADVFYQTELDSGAFIATKYPTTVTHNFSIFGREDKDIAGAYCIIRLKGSEFAYMEIMTRQELDAILTAVEKKNKGKMGPAYREHRGRMFRKAPISRLCTGGTIPLHDELMTMAASADIRASLASSAGIIPEARVTRAAQDMAALTDKVKGELPEAIDAEAETVKPEPEPEDKKPTGNAARINAAQEEYDLSDTAVDGMIADLGLPPNPDDWQPQDVARMVARMKAAKA